MNTFYKIARTLGCSYATFQLISFLPLGFIFLFSLELGGFFNVAMYIILYIPIVKTIYSVEPYIDGNTEDMPEITKSSSYKTFTIISLIIQILLAVGNLFINSDVIQYLHIAGTLLLSYYIIISLNNLKEIGNSLSKDNDSYREIHRQTIGFVFMISAMFMTYVVTQTLFN